MQTDHQPGGALAGVLIVELSEVFQAPLAAQMLGDLGAEVIKIERTSGEILRNLDTDAARQGGMSSYYAAVNRNKQSMVLDLKSADGRDDLSRLLSRADVFIHNYRPGALQRLGFGYEAVRALNPRLIYASASGFGETGPLAAQGGQDLVLQSLSGMAMAAAGDDGIPRFANVPAIDFASGTLLSQGILAALFHRERSGEGQQVSVSLLDTAMAMQSLEAASQIMYQSPTHWFTRGLNFVFKVSDGWVTVIGFFRENPLALMCRALGIPDASQELRFSGVEAQVGQRRVIEAMLAPVIAPLSCEEAVSRFQAADVLCAPVLTLEQALQHPQVQHNELLVSTPIPAQANASLVGSPLRLSATPPALRRGPPALDGDRADIRQRHLQAQIPPQTRRRT